jgi:hypothetical protein
LRIFDFSPYPVIQQHLRHLAAFGMLDEPHIRELIESVGEHLERLERLGALQEFNGAVQNLNSD